MTKYQYARILVMTVLVPVIDPSSIARAQASAAVSAAPAIERFDLDPPERLVPGEALIFRITGTPRANASVSIAGLNRKVALREVMPGIYEGAYTMKPGDPIGPYSAVTANLRLGKQELQAILGQPLVEGSSVATLR